MYCYHVSSLRRHRLLLSLQFMQDLKAYSQVLTTTHDARIKEGVLLDTSLKTTHIGNDADGADSGLIERNQRSNVVEHADKHVTFAIFCSKDADYP